MLYLALRSDPDLSSLPEHEVVSIMLMLYISTGCDFISHFKSVEKALFFNNFFQHTGFISGKQMTGHLGQTLSGNKTLGFLAVYD